MLTRLELFLKSRGIKPARLAREAGYTRQHVLRLREGVMEPTPRSAAEIVGAVSRMLGAIAAVHELFEPAAARGSRTAVVQKEVERLLADGVETTFSYPEATVRYLLRHGERTIDRAPEEAERVFRAVLDIAATLAAAPPPLVASFRGHAERGRANALRHLGRLEEALAALAAAGRHFVDARHCQLDIGRVHCTRATIFFKLGRWEEALASAAHARRVFRRTGARRRTAHVDVLVGCIHMEKGNVDAAHATFSAVLKPLASLRDDETLARTWLNLAVCAIERREASMARYWLVRAAAVFLRLGMETELARARWNMATYLVRFRDPARGLRALWRAHRRFTALGMEIDAAHVLLDIVEFLLESGAEHAAVEDAARRAADAFLRAGVRGSAAAALAHLEEAVRAGAASAHVVRDVRTRLLRAEAAARP